MRPHFSQPISPPCPPLHCPPHSFPPPLCPPQDGLKETFYECGAGDGVMDADEFSMWVASVFVGLTEQDFLSGIEVQGTASMAVEGRRWRAGLLVDAWNALVKTASRIPVIVYMHAHLRGRGPTQAGCICVRIYLYAHMSDGYTYSLGGPRRCDRVHMYGMHIYNHMYVAHI